MQGLKLFAPGNTRTIILTAVALITKFPRELGEVDRGNKGGLPILLLASSVLDVLTHL